MRDDQDRSDRRGEEADVDDGVFGVRLCLFLLCRKPGGGSSITGGDGIGESYIGSSKSTIGNGLIPMVGVLVLDELDDAVR